MEFVSIDLQGWQVARTLAQVEASALRDCLSNVEKGSDNEERKAENVGETKAEAVTTGERNNMGMKKNNGSQSVPHGSC